VGPLEGIKVIELGHWVAIPAACAIFSDWGADVIKIEDPRGGDAARGFMAMGFYPFSLELNGLFEVDNRNKRSLAVDLRQQAGREILYRLVKEADIFATNFVPEVLKNLGADYETISGVNPRIVYVSLTGYGEAGPDKDLPGFDWSAYWARSGIMATLGEPDGPPTGPRPGIGDHPTSMMLTGVTLAALLHRERTGRGQKVSLSLLHCGLWQLAIDVQTGLFAGQHIPRSSRKTTGNPLANYYRCRDGRWIILCMPQADRYWPGFCRAIGREDLINDPRFKDLEARRENSALLIALLDEVFATAPREEWERRLTEQGCVWGRVQTVEEVIADPQARENGFFVPVDHPSAGRVEMIAAPGQFSQTPGSIRSAAPQLGQHTEEILLEAGYTWEDITRFKDQGVIP